MSQSKYVQELYGNPASPVTGMFNTVGVHAMLAAPGVNRNIHIVVFQLQSESETSHTVFVRQGIDAGNEIWRHRMVADGDGVLEVIPPGMALRLSANKQLSLVLTAAAQVGYNIIYYVK